VAASPTQSISAIDAPLQLNGHSEREDSPAEIEDLEQRHETATNSSGSSETNESGRDRKKKGKLQLS
jgi:hypothetical protein